MERIHYQRMMLKKDENQVPTILISLFSIVLVNHESYAFFFYFSVKEKVTQKLWQSFKVIWAFVESVMVSMIRTLNKISKDYRYVVRVLAQEKRELKVRNFNFLILKTQFKRINFFCVLGKPCIYRRQSHSY